MISQKTLSSSLLSVAIVVAGALVLAGCPDNASKQGATPTSTATASAAASGAPATKPTNSGSGW